MSLFLAMLLSAAASAGPSEERDLLKASCERGEAPECTTLGLKYRDGEGAPVDAHYALGLFRKACELGDARACIYEADAYRTGSGASRDPDRAVEMFTQACTEKGHGEACRALGEIYILGDGVKRDWATSNLWFEQGCDAGDAESCVGAAMGTERGDQGVADPQLGRRMLAQACQLGHARGCTLLGGRYRYGRDGAVRDWDLAAAMYSVGCELKDAEACREVGWMSLKGKGLPVDPEAARIYLTDACAGDDYIGCRYLSDALKSVDLVKALRAAEHGCSLGDAPSCKKQKSLKWQIQLRGQ